MSVKHEYKKDQNKNLIFDLPAVKCLFISSSLNGLQSAYFIYYYYYSSAQTFVSFLSAPFWLRNRCCEPSPSSGCSDWSTAWRLGFCRFSLFSWCAVVAELVCHVKILLRGWCLSGFTGFETLFDIFCFLLRFLLSVSKAFSALYFLHVLLLHASYYCLCVFITLFIGVWCLHIAPAAW